MSIPVEKIATRIAIPSLMLKMMGNAKDSINTITDVTKRFLKKNFTYSSDAFLVNIKEWSVINKGAQAKNRIKTIYLINR